jgi:N-acetylmuramoyl-L-alanine amidase
MTDFIMIAAFYLAKVVLVSALLFVYYRLFLRNRVFHQYNRYYLLGATLASLVLPLVPVRLPNALSLTDPAAVLAHVFHAITPGHLAETERAPAMTAAGWPDTRVWLASVYGMTIVALFAALCRRLWHLRRLPRKYPRQRLGDIELFMTREPGSPFSFLNRLFWNEDIDIDSGHGRRIFLHEWYHIRQRHTLDLLWLKTVLVFFWVNPFFYLIYREIRTIHEFLADRYAAADGDRYEYAELLVWHSIHDRAFSMLQPFAQSSIKRRISMLTQLHSSRPGYWSRVMVLPVAFVLMCAFSVRRPAAGGRRGASFFTVVIDAGHGGSDAGAVAGDVKEKDINLALALKVSQLAPAYHINVVLTRRTDELAGGKSDIRSSLEYRAAMAKDSKADLFVSLHVNSSAGEVGKHGFSAFVSKDNPYATRSAKLGSLLLDALKNSYPTDDILHQPVEHVYVLRETAMPAVLLECGYIDNPADLAFINDSQDQEKVARDILQGIQLYQQEQAKGTGE